MFSCRSLIFPPEATADAKVTWLEHATSVRAASPGPQTHWSTGRQAMPAATGLPVSGSVKLALPFVGSWQVEIAVEGYRGGVVAAGRFREAREWRPGGVQDLDELAEHAGPQNLSCTSWPMAEGGMLAR